MIGPPSECPTRRYGPGSPDLASRVCRSSTIAVGMGGTRGGSLHPVPGPIVGAGAAERRELRQHGVPRGESEVSQSCLEHDGWCPATDAIDVHRSARLDLDEPAGRVPPSVVAPMENAGVHRGSNQCEHEADGAPLEDLQRQTNERSHGRVPPKSCGLRSCRVILSSATGVVSPSERRNSTIVRPAVLTLSRNRCVGAGGVYGDTTSTPRQAKNTRRHSSVRSEVQLPAGPDSTSSQSAVRLRGFSFCDIPSVCPMPSSAEFEESFHRAQAESRSRYSTNRACGKPRGGSH